MVDSSTDWIVCSLIVGASEISVLVFLLRTMPYVCPIWIIHQLLMFNISLLEYFKFFFRLSDIVLFCSNLYYYWIAGYIQNVHIIVTIIIFYISFS